MGSAMDGPTGGESVPIERLFGAHLIGREVGAHIRREFFARDPSTWPRALNFEDVEQATESCIDEIFGSLVKTFGIDAVKRVGIESASPSVRDTIDYVLSILAEPPASVNVRALVQALAAQRGRRVRVSKPHRTAPGRVRKKK